MKGSAFEFTARRGLGERNTRLTGRQWTRGRGQGAIRDTRFFDKRWSAIPVEREAAELTVAWTRVERNAELWTRGGVRLCSPV